MPVGWLSYDKIYDSIGTSCSTGCFWACPTMDLGTCCNNCESLALVAWFKPVLIPRFVVKHTWIFSLLLLAFMSLSVCASYYRIFDSVWSVLLICFIIGSLSGFVFANTVCAVPLIVEPKYREFCLGLVTIGESAGVLIASLAGLAVEPILRKHCSHIANKTALCYTRPTTNKWSASTCSIKG